jgi:hypothetical protein
MDFVTLAKQAALYLHVIAFAVAIAEVFRGDLRLLRQRRIDPLALARTARLVSYALLVLWASGLILIYIDTGFDPAAILSKPKLVAKLIVVAALSANGALLHTAAFPLLENGRRTPYRAALVCSLLGSISTVSWLYAAFLGVGRVIAPAMTLELFLALYGVALLGGLVVAAFVVAPMLARRIAAPGPTVTLVARAPDEQHWRDDAETAAPTEAVELRRSA